MLQTRIVRRCVWQRNRIRRDSWSSITLLGQIHYITESIRCCGAGTAADTEFTTALISSNMELHALSTGRKPRVVTAMTMLKQMLFRSKYGRLLATPIVLIVCPQISGPYRCCTCIGWCRCNGPASVHYSPSWLHGQASIRNNGFW